MPELVSSDNETEELTSSDENRLEDDREEKPNYDCNELRERLVVLSTTLSSLKQTLRRQKEQLKEEIKDTKEFVKEFRNFSQEVGRLTYDFQTKQQKPLEATFKEQILEAENMCKIEMSKIQNTVDSLISLQTVLTE